MTQLLDGLLTALWISAAGCALSPLQRDVCRAFAVPVVTVLVAARLAASATGVPRASSRRSCLVLLTIGLLASSRLFPTSHLLLAPVVLCGIAGGTLVGPALFARPHAGRTLGLGLVIGFPASLVLLGGGQWLALAGATLVLWSLAWLFAEPETATPTA